MWEVKDLSKNNFISKKKTVKKQLESQIKIYLKSS